jgi:hypothetical protein
MIHNPFLFSRPGRTDCSLPNLGTTRDAGKEESNHTTATAARKNKKKKNPNNNQENSR